MNTVRRFLYRQEPKTIVNVVRLQGIISPQYGSKKNLNLRRVEKQLNTAFNKKKGIPKAVCLEINSPGGSPVQSALIFHRIRWLSARTNIPVLAFVEDYAASGGYMLALAAQEIFINEFSAVGSIGALMSSFGFVKTLDKLGMDRRVASAGQNKLRLDPFQEEKPEDVQWIQEKLHLIHKNFIEMVKSRRLNIDPNNKEGIYEANLFFGKEAVDIGLADGMYTDVLDILTKRFGSDVEIKRIDPPKSFIERMIENRGISYPVHLDVDEIIDSVEHKYQAESKFKL